MHPNRSLLRRKGLVLGNDECPCFALPYERYDRFMLLMGHGRAVLFVGVTSCTFTQLQDSAWWLPSSDSLAWKAI